MDNIKKVLTYDPLEQSEGIFGKHWSQFTEDEMKMSLGLSLIHNKNKSEILKNNNDTYSSMEWFDFIDLIELNGFICGLKYDIYHDDDIDEAILYYRNDGLILWATSYFNKKSVNGGTLYGEISYEEFSEEIFSALNGCSHGGVGTFENIRSFNKDVREGLFYTINNLSNLVKFNSQWKQRDKFLWFVDYVENKKSNYDYKAITLNKISQLPLEAKEIIGNDKITV